MEQQKIKSSPFDKETLQYFRKLLLEKRQEAREQADKIEHNISDSNESDDADYSSFTHHPCDVGTEIEGQEMNDQLRERSKKFIGEIDDARERIESGTYGICQSTGNPSSKGRLEAVPHTRHSMEAKEQGIDKK